MTMTILVLVRMTTRRRPVIPTAWTTPLMRMMRTTTSLTLILRNLSLLTFPILTRGPRKVEDDHGVTLVDPSLQTIAL